MFIKISVSSLSLLSLLLLPAAFAEKTTSKDFTVEGNTVHTEIPAGWSAMQGMFNVPITFVSEKGLQEQRSVIEIIPYGEKDTNNELSKVKKDPAEYYAQKEAWLDSVKGESMRTLPLTETKKDGALIYSIGMKYKTPQGEFMDKTYYVSSKSKQLYFIKTMVPLDMLDAHQNIVSEVVNTISAKN
jgi:hypothetical protein